MWVAGFLSFDVVHRPDVRIAEWFDIRIFSSIASTLVGTVRIALDDCVREIIVKVGIRGRFASQVPHASSERSHGSREATIFRSVSVRSLAFGIELMAKRQEFRDRHSANRPIQLRQETIVVSTPKLRFVECLFQTPPFDFDTPSHFVVLDDLLFG